MVAYFFAAATLAGALTALLFFATAAPGFGIKAKTCVEAQTANKKSNNTRFIIIILVLCCYAAHFTSISSEYATNKRKRPTKIHRRETPQPEGRGSRD
jgi:hypothetical protein